MPGAKRPIPCWRLWLLFVQHISDCCFQAILIPDNAVAAALRPPLLSNYCRRIAPTAFSFIQFAGTPRLELLAHGFRFPIRGHHYMKMIRATIHGM